MTPGGGDAAVADPVVQVRALTREFGVGTAAHRALHGVSLEVTRGEAVLVAGPSGCGKSTLLATIGGLDRTYAGSLALFGRDVAQLGDDELSDLRGERIGFVFQAFHLLDHLTVLENVMLPAVFGPTPLAEAESVARDVLARVSMLDRAADSPSTLSGGQRQRVAIARALLRRPDLILCDEPTGNLDRDTGEQIIDLFGSIHDELGATFVIVTHEDRMRRIATRSLSMLDGRLVP